MSDRGESPRPPNIVKKAVSNVVVPVAVGAGLSLVAGETIGPIVSAKIAAFFHTDLQTFMLATDMMRQVNNLAVMFNLSEYLDLKKVTDLANFLGKSSSELSTFASVMAAFYLKGKFTSRIREVQPIPRNLDPRYFKHDGTPTEELENLTGEVIQAVTDRLPDKPITEMFLVGSQTDGNPKPGSDLDLVVGVKDAPKGATPELDINKRVNPGFGEARNFTQLTRDKIQGDRPALDVSIKPPEKARKRYPPYYDVLRRKWITKEEEE